MIPDSSQQQIVALHGCRALVLAGPGCGKTHLLTRRIIHATASEGIAFADMVCLTFTNRASREMNSRIKAVLGYAPDDLFVGNLHRFCCRFLHANALLAPDIGLLDEDDRDTWLSDSLGLKRKFERKQITDLAMLLYQQEHDFPQGLRRRLDFTPDQSHIRAASAYRDFKAEHKLVDFDDLLLLTYTALTNHPPHTLAGSNFKWVQVDEVQDLTPLQLAIIDLITADGPSTAIYLGDEQQAIFEFLGAGGPALDKIKLRCENSIYRLARNYRSPAYLVKLCNDFAASCLDINPAHLPQAVSEGERPDGALQMLPATDNNLPLAVAAKVRAWRNDFPDKRIAVLTRTNDEAEEISALMAAHSIENTLVGRNDLFRRVPFKTVYAHLSVIASDRQPAEWARLLYQTKAVRTLSEARSLTKRLDKMNLSAACFIEPECYKEQLSRLDENDKSFLSSMIITQTAKKLNDAYGELYRHTLTLLNMTEQTDRNTLAAECDYAYRYLSQRNFISHIERWDAVISFIKRTLGSEPLSRQLFERLPELRTFNEGDLLTDEPVTVITVHKAKGLEFDNVVLFDASQKNLPHASDDARVYYVAFSRAKERLAVFHSSKLSAPVASVSHHFDHISPDEVEAMSLLERLHSRPIRRNYRLSAYQHLLTHFYGGIGFALILKYRWTKLNRGYNVIYYS